MTETCPKCGYDTTSLAAHQRGGLCGIAAQGFERGRVRADADARLGAAVRGVLDDFRWTHADVRADVDCRSSLRAPVQRRAQFLDLVGAAAVNDFAARVHPLDEMFLVIGKPDILMLFHLTVRPVVPLALVYSDLVALFESVGAHDFVRLGNLNKLRIVLF